MSTKKNDEYFAKREAELIGAILVAPHHFATIASDISEESFGAPLLKRIWKIINTLTADGKPVGAPQVLMELEASGEPFEMQEFVDVASHLGAPALQLREEVKEGARRRKVQEGLISLAVRLQEGEKIDELIIEGQDLFLGASEVSSSQKGLEQVDAPLLRAMETIQSAYEGQGLSGLSTSFQALDEITGGGLRSSELYILAARPAMGKTALALQIALSASATTTAALFSLEMPSEQLCYRLISSRSIVSGEKLRSGLLTEIEVDRIVRSVEGLYGSQLFLDDQGGVSTTHIRGQLRLLRSRGAKLGVVIIDYLQLMSSTSKRRGGNREQEISEISRNLKEIAKEFEVPIICLSQLNRGVESRANKRPLLSDLRESGAIEQDADMVWFVYRDEYYNRESEDKGIAEIIIAKNRSGSTGTVKLKFAGATTTFHELNEY